MVVGIETGVFLVAVGVIGTASAVSYSESLVEASGGDVPSLATLLSNDPRQINVVFLTLVVPVNFVKKIDSLPWG